MSLFIGYTKRPGPRLFNIVLVVIILLVIATAIIFANIVINNSREKVQVKTTPTSTLTTLTHETGKVESLPLRDTRILVEKMVFTNMIDNKNLPTDSFDEIPLKKIGRVYCYTKVDCAALPQTIRHIWLDPRGSVVADIRLLIVRRPANTWSYVDLYGAKTGKWQVEARNLASELVAKKSFLVYQ